MLSLYEWQAECLNLWARNGYRGIVNAVTGSGKTLLALTAVHHLEIAAEKPLRVKIVVPQTFLAAQWKDEIKRCLIAKACDIGLYSGKRKDSGRKYMIYVVNSARYNLARHILSDISRGFAVLLIADECHHYGSSENSRIFDFYKVLNKNAPYYALGLSATPEIVNYRAITAPIGPEIYSYDLTRALRERVISRFILFSVRLSFTRDENEQYTHMSDGLSKCLVKLKKMYPELEGMPSNLFFSRLQSLAASISGDAAQIAGTALALMHNRRALCHMALERPACAMSIVKMLPANTRIILFCERIQAAEILYRKLLETFPDQAGLYHSKMTEYARQDILDRFNHGTIRLLVCCKALDEGLNIPSTDAGIIVSGSMSIRQRVQRLGRMLRRSMEIKRIYYLFIGESNEDRELVFGLRTMEYAVPMITLRYRNGAFFHSEYVKLRNTALNYVSSKRNEPGLLYVLSENIDMALVRGDFLFQEQVCRENIRLSHNIAERNYWTSVLYVILARSGKL